VPLRSAAIDEVVRRAVKSGTGQLVLLGAGLDARAWRMPELAGTAVFELDHPSTGGFKRERVAGLEPLAGEVTLVAIDFEREHIDQVLARTSFDPARPSVWIWEGVAMYLSPPAVEATLRVVAELSAPSSVLAMTYLAPDYGSRPLKAVARRLARWVGEPVNAELRPEELAALLGRLGLDVESDDTAPDWARRYWPEAEARRVRVWEHLLVAVRRVGVQETSIS
jgi:methyltransferase (TIGR00027 family)